MLTPWPLLAFKRSDVLMRDELRRGGKRERSETIGDVIAVGRISVLR